MGLEYARQLAAKGFDLILVSNRQEELEQAQEELSRTSTVKVITRFQDLARQNAADELMAFCQEQSMEVEILINNAGMFFFEELTPENEAKVLAMMQLHIYTPTRLCLLFGEEMKRRGHGYLINMSSMAAKLPYL